MKRIFFPLIAILLLGSAPPSPNPPHTPWQEAGLSEREAAAHLLDRLTFGPRPGDIEAMIDEGIGSWLDRQLTASHRDQALQLRLADLDILGMPVEAMVETFPPRFALLKEMEKAGIVPKDRDPKSVDRGSREGREMRRKSLEVMQEKGWRSQRELLTQMTSNKVLRAAYSENQLQEVMVDFWFNHFNVSLTDNQTRVFVLSYERDAIRPEALGGFPAMLLATAKHPAMLTYLDNSRSFAEEGQRTTLSESGLRNRYGGRNGNSMGRGGNSRGRGRGGFGNRGGRDRQISNQSAKGKTGRTPGGQRATGLNENYARELLELHTMGVDGGYSQEDVREVARAFTGWSMVPPRQESMQRMSRMMQSGAVQTEGLFMFIAVRHDAEKKKFLGHSLKAGRGLEDGLEVLDMVTRHPSTARHVATKLARRFVSDTPPEPLVNRLTDRYLASEGDITSMLRTLFDSPEFWSPEARRAKIKSPLELAISSVRALDAEVQNPDAILQWVARMGEPLYAYEAPTGYPDKAEFWVNTGGLLNRMNFGLQLATGRIPGVEFDLGDLTGQTMPDSATSAMTAYLEVFLPGQDTTATQDRLMLALSDPGYFANIEDSAEAAPNRSYLDFGRDRRNESQAQRGPRRSPMTVAKRTPPTVEEQVVGLILGSPEYQRR